MKWGGSMSLTSLWPTVDNEVLWFFNNSKKLPVVQIKLGQTNFRSNLDELNKRLT